MKAEGSAFAGRNGEEAGIIVGDARRGDPGGPPGDSAGPAADKTDSLRLKAMILAARYQGVELDPGEFRGASGEARPNSRPGRRPAACGPAHFESAGAIS